MALVPVIGGRLYVLVPTGTPAFQGRSHHVLVDVVRSTGRLMGSRLALMVQRKFPG